jgi:adenylate kinase family enzyme
VVNGEFTPPVLIGPVPDVRAFYVLCKYLLSLLRNGRIPENCLQATGEPLVRRSDDNEGTLRNRLGAFHEQTAPLVNYYQRRHLHTRVDAAQPMAFVGAQIDGLFDRLTTPKDRVVFV